MSLSPPRRPTVCVGVVCFRGSDVLLVRRRQPPRQGEWSLPGGRLEWGERLADAALRELAEETGVRARLTGLIEVVDGLFGGSEKGPPEHHFVLVDYAAEWLSGDPVAADDAADARFVSLDEAEAMVSWAQTRRIVRKAADLRSGGHGGMPATTP